VAGYIAAQVRQFASDYATLVRGIRSRAGAARIVVLNLPNLAAAPYTAGLSQAERRWMQELAVGFSREGANATAALGATVVDLMCDPRTYQPANSRPTASTRATAATPSWPPKCSARAQRDRAGAAGLRLHAGRPVGRSDDCRAGL
jgi:hypothetical protein